MSKKIWNLLFISAFGLIITLPSIGNWLGISSASDNFEGRAISALPRPSRTNLKEYPQILTGFFNSNFGFRNLIIRKSLEIKLAYSQKANVNQTVGQTLVGRDGWYFLNSEDEFQNILFTPEELVEIKQKLVRQTEKFLQKGVPFLLVVVPDKESIYPEYYPLPKVLTEARFDQLLKYLRENSQIEIVDLRSVLKNHKDEKPLYYLTDSHWTNFGAFIAYQEIMRRYQQKNPAVYIPQLADFDIEEVVYSNWKGDLGLPLNVKKQNSINVAVKFTPKKELLNQKKIGKLLIKGDSYFEITHNIEREPFLKNFPEAKPYLDVLFKNPDGTKPFKLKYSPDIIKKLIEENFKDKNLQNNLINYIYNSLAIDEDVIGLNSFFPLSFETEGVDPYPNYVVFDDDVIEKEKPDLIIYEIVERNLRRLLNDSKSD